MGDVWRRLSRRRPRRKIVLVGDSGVGKSAALQVLKGRELPEKHELTVVNNFVHKVKASRGETVDLAVWDVGGQDQYERVRKLAYENAHLVLIVYAVNDKESLRTAAERWAPEVKATCPEALLLLLGCKSDLNTKTRDCVSTKEAQSTARAITAQLVTSCSATDPDSVHTAFREVAAAALQRARSKQRSACVLL